MTTTTHPGQADAAAYVARQPDGVRAADLAAALGITEASARTYLSRLADNGHAIRLGRGLYGPADGERKPPGERNDGSAETQQRPASTVTSGDAERNSERNAEETSPGGASENATAPAGPVVASAGNATAAAGPAGIAPGEPRRCHACHWQQQQPGVARCEQCGAALDREAEPVQVSRDQPGEMESW